MIYLTLLGRKTELDNIQKIQKKLGYQFSDEKLLIQALTTKPYTIENPGSLHFEPLATLGDAVVKLILVFYSVNDLNFIEKGEIDSFKQLNEGRQNEGEKFTSFMGIDLNLIYSEMRRGKGEINNNNTKIIPNYFGELFEAIIGAIYIDSNEDLNIIKTIVFKILFSNN